MKASHLGTVDPHPVQENCWPAKSSGWPASQDPLPFIPRLRWDFQILTEHNFLVVKGIEGQHYHVTWFLSSSHQTRWSCWTTTWSPTCPKFSSPSPSSATSPLGKIPSAGLRLWLQPQHVVQVLLQGDGELLPSAIFCLVQQTKPCIYNFNVKM